MFLYDTGMLDALQEIDEESRERTRAQKGLARELAAAAKMVGVGELAAGVVHQLGSPLSVIDGRAQRSLRATRSHRGRTGT